MDQIEEALDRFAARELLQRIGYRDPIGGVIQGPPPHADDLGRLQELFVEKTVK